MSRCVMNIQRLVCALVPAAVLFVPFASAGLVFEWTGRGSDDNWSTPENWTVIVSPFCLGEPDFKDYPGSKNDDDEAIIPEEFEVFLDVSVCLESLEIECDSKVTIQSGKTLKNACVTGCGTLANLGTVLADGATAKLGPSLTLEDAAGANRWKTVYGGTLRFEREHLELQGDFNAQTSGQINVQQDIVTSGTFNNPNSDCSAVTGAAGKKLTWFDGVPNTCVAP